MSVPFDEAELPSNTPKAGDVLASKYRVESILGVGGMGMVLLVRHIDLGQQMAIKMMMPGVIHDDQAAARFVREARAAAAIQSEHVVRIFDVGTFDSGLPYMVMELLRGEDLSQVLARETQLPLEDAVDYVLQAAHAIAEAHARGIVHRDLKPSNLFVTTRSDGTALVKVLDFGISKALNPEADVPSSANLTATSAVMGSPLYMSPEQVRNAMQVDARTDIWALGVILHEILTGAPAFSADTLPGICAAITADEPPPLRSLREDAPPELEAVLLKCLEKNITKRYQTTKELMAALRPFASNSGRLEPTSIPAAMTMREAGSIPPSGSTMSPSRKETSDGRTPPRSHPRSQPKRRSGANVVQIEPGARSSGKMQDATSLASSTATLSWRHLTDGSTGRGRKGVAMMAGGALLIAGAIGAVVWPSASQEEGAKTSPTGANPTGARRTFTLFIDSSPAGSEVLEGVNTVGRTPMQISIDNESTAKEPRHFTVRRAGYLPYSIVQGPSDDNVRIYATLGAATADNGASAAQTGAAAATTTVAPSALPASPAPKEHAAPTPAPIKGKGAAPRVEPTPAAPVTTPPPPAAPSAAPPPPPSDIRLKR
jgi:serine/threonine-protein kinase